MELLCYNGIETQNASRKRLAFVKLSAQERMKSMSKTVPYRRSRFQKFLRLLWRQRALILLCVIPVALVILFQYVPMYGVLIAFKKFKASKGVWGSPWLDPWYKNYLEFFNNVNCSKIITQTLKVGVFSLIFTYPMPIILALLLNECRAIKFKRTVQTISYLPPFISWAIVGGLVYSLLSPSSGFVNTVIKSLGGEPIYFMGDSRYTRGIIVISGIWKGIGWGSILYLAALTGINQEL